MGLTNPHHKVVLTGNTAGAMATISSGSMTLAGGNNITLSQAGNAVTISGPNTSAQQTAISGIIASNATYTSGTVQFTGVGGGITVSSNTGQRIDISVAAPVAQSVQTQNVVVPAGSNTTYTSGTVVFSGSNAVTVRSTTGQAIIIDAPTQTAQTQNLHNVTLSGNTAGAMAQVSSGTMTLAGGNNITLSQAGNAITISGAAVGGAQTAISGIAASNTTYTSGSVTFTGVGGGVTVSSNTGQRVDISVAAPVAQTVQTQNLHNVTLSGNTAGVMAQISSGTMTLAGGNNITLSQNGNAVTISAGAGGAETQTAISGIVASNATYTSGTVTFTGVGGGVTVSSNTGQRIDISVAAQSVQTQGGFLNIGVSTGGNTAGDTGAATGSRMVFVGAGAASLSQATAAAASTVTISVPTQTVQTQGGFASMGVSTGGNTAGNTTVNTGSRMVFVASGGITASQDTAAGASTINLSVPAGASATGNLGSIVFSNQTVSSGGLTITGSNAATVKSSAGPTLVIDVPTQTVQTQNVVVPSGSNTTYTSGTVVFSGSNAVTVRSTTGQAIIIDSPVQTVQTQSRFNLTLSGNSTSGGAGYALISSGVMTLAGGPNITLSQDGNAVSVSAAAGGGAGFSAGVSTGGNTAGSTGVSGTRLVLVGTNNVTLSQSTDANGATVSFSGAGGGAGQFSGGVSNLGNTSGSTALTGTQMVLAGGNNITLSQSTGANGATVTFSGAASWAIPSFSYWENAAGQPSGTATAALTSGNPVHRQFYVFPLHAMNDVFPGNMTVSTMYLGFSGSQAATTSTLAYTYSIYGGIYTMNGSSLSLLNSFSTALSTAAANASISSLLQGHRWISLHSSQWSAAPSLSQTNYWMGIGFSTAGESKGLSSMVWRGPTLGSAIRSGIMGVGTTTGNSSKLHAAWHGIYTATTAAPPTSITKGQIAIPGNTLSAGAVPHIVFDNMGLLE